VPRSTDEGFRDFLSKLTPSQGESAAATSHRTSIQTRLHQDFGLRRFVRTGSFGNGTSISGYSDVDYLACLQTSSLTTNSTYSLGKVRDSMAGRFPYTAVRVSCPAVVVPFGNDVAETTEIVPADYIKDINGFPIYDIADCAGGWMRASPDAHLSFVASQNDRLGGKVKPLVRFVKAWKYFREVPISSFYLELRVAKYAQGESSIVYHIDVARVLRSLLDGGLAAMQDPMGVSGYIAACKSDVQRADALSKLATAVGRAEKASSAAGANDMSTAFAYWRLLYDDLFPTYYY
jgi:hypothetical protein